MNNLIFRVWDIHQKKWCSADSVILSTDGKATDDPSSFDHSFACFIVQQWSGLLSQDGKKLFVGDIIHAESGDPEELHSFTNAHCTNYEIIFEDGCYQGIRRGPGFFQVPLNSLTNIKIVTNLMEQLDFWQKELYG